MQKRNICCFNARPRPDWSSVAMTTEVSNQQNALIPNDLQYINAILSTVSISRSGGMIATALLNPRRFGKSSTYYCGMFWNVLYSNPGNRSSVTQAIAERPRPHLKSKL